WPRAPRRSVSPARPRHGLRLRAPGADRHAIVNARVSIEPGGVSVTTNADGKYSLVLPVGRYTLTISAAGYSPKIIANVVVGPNAVASSDASLLPAVLTTGDFNGDRRADFTAWDPSTGTWWI